MSNADAASHPDEPFHDGLAIRHDKWGNEVLLWMGQGRGEETIAVRDLVRRDVTTQARINDMRRRVQKLDDIRSFIEITRDGLLTPEQRARIAKQDGAQAVCASSIRSASSAAAAPAQLKVLCFVCGTRVTLQGTSVADHIANCIETAESIVKRHNLEEPALPSVPPADPPGASRSGDTGDGAEHQPPSSDEVDLYNRHARRSFVACMRTASDNSKVSIIELGRLLSSKGA
jgi:hypothetical protein